MEFSRLPLTRRTFLHQASALGLASASHRAFARQMSMPMPAAAHPGAQKLPPMLRSATLPSFVDPLPVPAVAKAHGGHLRIAMRETHAQMHRDLPPTRLWTYADVSAPPSPAGLSPLIELRSGHALHIDWINELPTHHFLPIDFSLHGCGHDLPEVRACVHLHGGRTPSASDGHPDDWVVAGHTQSCHYPLQQDAATLWYHDHAMGLNRLNIYAGLFGAALVRDSTEDALRLPSGRYEVPLLLCDRILTAEGQLFYPTSGDPGHPWVPEFDGDAVLVNQKIRPFLEVEPRLYRLRIVNAANSRFFNLALSGQHPFHQIGSDQGLLAAPVTLTRLSLAPAERADLLVDFSPFASQNVQLQNGVLDLLQFRVAAASRPQAAHSLPTSLRSIARTPESSATLTRRITLDEAVDHIGNSMLMYIDKKRWHEPVTEMPKLGSTEIWEFVNLTEDTHPMHLHLVRFQVLDRRVFDVFSYRNNKGLRYLADAVPPAANELGWKDTVPCPPGMITRMIVQFDRYPGRYLYHCHILEHEANDMMRPFELVA
jgi:spore coat protein A